MCYNSASFDGQTLENFAKAKLNEMKDYPTTESVTDPKETVFNGISGYQFTIIGMGRHIITLLPHGQNRYFMVNNSSMDPTNQGYEKTVEKMLSTLKLI
ncbi:hypothetical protein A2W14_07410 [Candidatus Gottesmanbacteria bacterium RBG_16_37_8]|uniref:Beta-lactamase-related domain-containing protein n=1 Tax=Candidatus Gottesmanbacteria bacterium RBG_16_37_8 TaxID=1798371 RepID=A0A1F5YT44_9BACT|nr:MAG: hypothetical protein A2W14_07410 [Candidatus Gottesmanbacteria bacterium RBG_16_37_8]